MASCNCPPAAALTVIPDSTCPFDLNQIQKVVFQRAGYTWVSPTVDITTKADWDTLIAAADDTKVVSTPLIGGDPVIESGEAITVGAGSNATLNGVEEVNGTNPSKFSCMFKSLEPATEKALKAIMCEQSLVAYFVTEKNRIYVANISGTEDTGIAIQSQFVSDRNVAGFAAKDTHTLSFSMKAGWSEDIREITPAVGFNPLSDL